MKARMGVLVALCVLCVGCKDKAFASDAESRVEPLASVDEAGKKTEQANEAWQERWMPDKSTVRRGVGGEMRWRMACEHAFEMAKAEAALKGESRKNPTAEELDAAMESCVQGFKGLPANTADAAAGCMLQKIDLKGIGVCMKGAVKKAEAADVPQ